MSVKDLLFGKTTSLKHVRTALTTSVIKILRILHSDWLNGCLNSARGVVKLTY